MKSFLEDLHLKRLLREGTEGRLDVRKGRSGEQEARDLLEKERELLRQLHGCLESKSGHDLRAALEWCASQRRADSERAAARRWADTVYNAYYTHDGIRDRLVQLEDYAGDEAGEIDDPDALYMKIYSDRLRILRFLYNKISADCAEPPLPGESQEPVTEQLLKPLGWTPVEEDIRRSIQELQGWLEDRDASSGRRSGSLSRLGNAWEEHHETLRQNFRLLTKPFPDPSPADGPAIQEKQLMEAMTRVLAGSAFDALARKPGCAEEYRNALDSFVELARTELLEPFRRT